MTARQKFTQAQVIDALRETKGMVYLAAKRLGCEAQTIYNYRDRYPAVRAEMEAELETARRTLRGELVPVRRSSTEVVRAADFRGRRRA